MLNPGVRESNSAGSAKRSSREAELSSRRILLPTSCNMLEPVTKISDDPIDDQDVDKEQNKFSAGRDADSQHRAPDFHLRAPHDNSETQVVIFFSEAPNDQKVHEENGNEGDQRRAGDEKFRQGS